MRPVRNLRRNASAALVNVKCRISSARPSSGNPRSRASSSSENTSRVATTHPPEHRLAPNGPERYRGTYGPDQRALSVCARAAAPEPRRSEILPHVVSSVSFSHRWKDY